MSKEVQDKENSDQFVTSDAAQKKSDETNRKTQQNLAEDTSAEHIAAEAKEEDKEQAATSKEAKPSKAQKYVNDLKAKLKKLEEDYKELDDQHKRLWADHQNMQNRFRREREDLRKSAAGSTVEAILPALDNFDFAKKSLKADTDLEELNKCFDMLKAQFMMALESIGLQEINTDIAFDPELHEAVTSVPMPDKPEGTIIDVAKKGYKLNNKVIRAATVVVSAK